MQEPLNRFVEGTVQKSHDGPAFLMPVRVIHITSLIRNIGADNQ